ncbi:MAG TPA: polymorphic toxin-type HINT domain-containing protein, partial [Acetivibrio clariflavus]|nr:polymorphic toxin-type HINT domain-containing protein [Acetivibrio clariflavus]
GEVIKTTFEHPFYVKDVDFVEAGKLQVGDKLLDSKGNVLVVEDKKLEITDEPVKVYNFKVDDFHTYHVGNNGILVHNANNYLKDPNKLLENGWEDVTPECIRKNTNSRILYYDPKTGTKVRFDLKAEEVPGYNGKDHYHIYNPNFTLVNMIITLTLT